MSEQSRKLYAVNWVAVRENIQQMTNSQAKDLVDEMLVYFGGQVMLRAVGESLLGVTESAGVPNMVGNCIVKLSEIDW